MALLLPWLLIGVALHLTDMNDADVVEIRLGHCTSSLYLAWVCLRKQTFDVSRHAAKLCGTAEFTEGSQRAGDLNQAFGSALCPRFPGLLGQCSLHTG